MVKAISPRVLLRALGRDEVANRRKSHPTAVGQNRDLPAATLRGAWLQNTEGRWFWSIAVQAVSAAGVRLHFNDFDIGQGKVWVHNGDPEHGELLGPWTTRGPLDSGDFWTELVGGDTVFIEYAPSNGIPGGKPPFSISEVFELWAYVANAAVNTSCFLDEMCYDGFAFVNNFSKGVAYLLFPNHTCTGTLVNDRNSTGTPYLITAGHCVLDASDAHAILAVFDFKTSSCNGSASSISSYPQVSGATLLTRSLHSPDGSTIIADQPDFAFVQLSRLPSAAYYSMGWNTNASSSDRLTSLSHPRNLPQRLAVGNIASSSDPNFYTIHLNQGAVDHGSSGSGLINDSGQLVAFDSYSSNTIDVSACDISDRDYGYTKFAAVYPFIKSWLEAAAPPKPIASLSPVSLNFGAQQMSTASASQSSTLKNIGQAALTISSITIQGVNAAEFEQTNNCGPSVPAGASCTLTVTFRPTALGPTSATLSIFDNADGSPHTVALSGTATAAPAGPVVLSQVTTNVDVLENGAACHTPPPMTTFLTTAPTIWLYFEVTGASVGDVYHISFYKPDGTLYTTLEAPSNYAGYECFSYGIFLAGYPPASYPGNWTVSVFWNQQSTPLFSRGYTIATPPVSSGLYFYPVSPCHLVDTRAGNGTSGEFGPPSVAAGRTRTFNPSSGGCPGIPSSARAYSLDITAVPTRPGGGLSYATIWPAGQPQPFVSTLNAFKGGMVSNAALVPAGSGGAVNLFVTDEADLMIDINGYFDSALSSTALAFYPIGPCRIADTRLASGPLGGPQISAGTTRDFPLGLSGCLPPGAAATSYSLNVTAIPAEPLGRLAIWPASMPRPPGISALSATFGDVTANATIAQAGGSGGAIRVYTSDRTDVALDISGYFAAPGGPQALLFHPAAPCRVADTRNAPGPFGGPILRGGTLRSFAVPSSSCNIPANASAYSLNVTVVPAGVLGYLTIWPAGQAQPFVSTLNSWDGRVVANAAIVPAGQNGAVSVFVSNDSHVVLDINGYFTAQ